MILSIQFSPSKKSFDNMKPESKVIASIMDGYKKSFILATATKMNLFNRIHMYFSTVLLLADYYKISYESMQRFLRVLESMELVKIKDETVELTSLGICTQNDLELQDYLLISSWNWIEDWSNLLPILIDGKQSDGSSWTNRAKNPMADLAFHQFMVTSQSNSLSFPISINQGKIIDLGGGLGFTLASILNSRPHVYGILFDLPHVIEHAKNHVLSNRTYQERCEFMTGSFLEKIPSSADLYLLNNILHDWNDDYAKKILMNCYQAMKAGARLIVTETFIPENKNDDYAAMTDIHLMVVHGGRKRKRAEYQTMLFETGFKTISTSIDSVEVEK